MTQNRTKHAHADHGSNRSTASRGRSIIPALARRLREVLSDMPPAQREVFLMECGLPPLDRRAVAEELVYDHYYVVVREVGRYFGYGNPALDLTLVATIALVRAADRYTEDHVDAGVTFESYSRWWITNAIERAIAETEKQ
jgi:DNA-directed RNA polymerase sigma subunit (sigma70/sigma32)